MWQEYDEIFTINPVLYFNIFESGPLYCLGRSGEINDLLPLSSLFDQFLLHVLFVTSNVLHVTNENGIASVFRIV